MKISEMKLFNKISMKKKKPLNEMKALSFLSLDPALSLNNKQTLEIFTPQSENESDRETERERVCSRERESDRVRERKHKKHNSGVEKIQTKQQQCGQKEFNIFFSCNSCIQIDW